MIATLIVFQSFQSTNNIQYSTISQKANNIYQMKILKYFSIVNSIYRTLGIIKHSLKILLRELLASRPQIQPKCYEFDEICFKFGLV